MVYLFFWIISVNVECFSVWACEFPTSPFLMFKHCTVLIPTMFTLLCWYFYCCFYLCTLSRCSCNGKQCLKVFKRNNAIKIQGLIWISSFCAYILSRLAITRSHIHNMGVLGIILWIGLPVISWECSFATLFQNYAGFLNLCWRRK